MLASFLMQLVRKCVPKPSLGSAGRGSTTRIAPVVVHPTNPDVVYVAVAS